MSYPCATKRKRYREWDVFVGYAYVDTVVVSSEMTKEEVYDLLEDKEYGKEEFTLRAFD